MLEGLYQSKITVTPSGIEPSTFSLQHSGARQHSIATGYGLDGPGIESRWGRDFLHQSRLALGPAQPPVLRVPRSFLGLKNNRRGDADPSPPSSAVVKKEQSYTSNPPVGRTACTEPQCLYKGALYVIVKVTHRHESLDCTSINLQVLLNFNF